ncbi:MAG: protein translocase subunit SecF [Polyangiaceae bacterium]|jgi:preprotein translocase subunit SecF|nr:protein translocase subunit SecF [Polyangiaceae bacterium]
MEFFKPGRYFNFMGRAKLWMTASLVINLAALALLFYPGLNFGTDFRGGTEVEIAFTRPIAAGELRSQVQKLGFGSPDVIQINDPANPNRFLLRVQSVSALTEEQRASIGAALCFAAPDGGELPTDTCPPEKRPTEMKFSPGGDRIMLRYENLPQMPEVAAAAKSAGVELRDAPGNPHVVSARDNKVEVQIKSTGDQLMDGLRAALGPDTVPEHPLRVEWVGPKAGKLLRDAALKSVSLSLLFIMAYIAFRFDMRFAPGAIVATIHDVLVVVGVLVVTRTEFSLTTVAAILTIIGYSVNDTVVIYDRIRENLGRHGGKSFPAIINLSVSETLSRTLLTGSTALMTLGTFMLLGTGAIKDFAFVMFFGTIVGTYSSIFIASPVTELIDRRVFGGSKSHGDKPRLQKRADAVV